MIAARHLPALAALLALAGIPTVVHSYMGTATDDGRTVTAVPFRLDGLEAHPGRHTIDWVRETYGTTDFIEREYGPGLTLFVARSYDSKRLYHHPENGVAHGDGYDRAAMIRRPDRLDVPIFVLDSGDRRSVYALLYDRQFIADPIRFQLRNALSLLVAPRALMTLFFVRSKSATSGSSAIPPPEDLLLAAIDSFVGQPGTVSK